MKIEIWSDYACPFCYIGKRRLEKALENFPKHEQVSLEFKSFQLDPNAPFYNGQDYYESLAQKFGSIERAIEMTKNVEQFAASVNLDLQFANVKSTNTYRAHRLAKYALAHHKNITIAEKLFHAHFIDGKDIGHIDTLVQIAKDAGLDKATARAILEDDSAYANEVDVDLSEAQQFNITGVPFFVFNRKLALSGAQEVETFQQALQQAWDSQSQDTN